MKDVKLFSSLPENFFVPLAYSNKEVYSDLIFLLYTVAQNTLSFGIDREIITEAFEDCIREEKDTIYIEEEELVGNTDRDKANYYMRKLEEYGWIYKETTNDYKEIINFQDYTISIIQTLLSIIKNEKVEYQGNIINIYHILFSSEKLNSGMVLSEVFKNTRNLIEALKTLNSNIKKYMDNLTKHKTPGEIMNVLFGDYTSEIIDKAYHRLRTSENISRYRPRIMDKLNEINLDEEFLKNAAEFYKSEKELTSIEEGYNMARDIIYQVKEAFISYDAIIGEIDNKNSKYIRAAVTRAKFLLNNTMDITGQIKSILQYTAEVYKKYDYNLTKDYVEEISDIFTLYSYGYIDETSFYMSNEGKKSFKPKSIFKKVISNEERERKLKEFKEKQEGLYSIEKINFIVEGLLNNKKVFRISEMPIVTLEDFIVIIYLRVYSNSPLVKYELKRIDSIVDKNGFEFRNFEIWRK